MIGIKRGDTVVAVLARVGNQIQWPLAKGEASVKLDQSHYFFTLSLPPNKDRHSDDNDDVDDGIGQEIDLLNYGVTLASKGQERLLQEFDKILETYSSFSVQEAREPGNMELIEGNVAMETSPEDLKAEEKKELMKESSLAYWTVLAPNVDDYSESVARMIAAGSGHLIKGILWCGDVTVDRLKWGNEFLKERMTKSEEMEVSRAAMRRIKRVNQLTKISEKVTDGILSEVSEFLSVLTISIVNSGPGKKFFGLIPGEIVLASLDSFNKVFDAIKVAGTNVMSTSSVVTTGLISQRYGEEAAKVTNEGLDAAGHAFGTAWNVFKIRKALTMAAFVANSSEEKAKSKK